MTCYWDSIYQELELEDYKILGVNKPNNIEGLIQILKNKNKIMDNVTWQDKYLSKKKKKEHYKAIKEYNIRDIKNGHLTSVCDSFLLLICELLNITIEHRFMNVPIKYTRNMSRKLIRFTSNTGHFQNVNTKSTINKTQNRLDRIREQARSDSTRQSWRSLGFQSLNRRLPH